MNAPGTRLRAASLALGVALACAAPPRSELRRFEMERPAMGTLFRVVLFADDGARAQFAFDAAFERLDALTACLSDYDPSSELSRLSQASLATAPGPWIPLSRDLAAVLSAAQELARSTDGAFDATCGQATRLWRRAIREREMPSAADLESARRSTDWTKLELSRDGRAARWNSSGARLDLGGIGKGYALDEMLESIERLGVSRALVVGGGDVVAGEAPPGAAGWIVAIDSGAPSDGATSSFVELRREALSTSGDAERRVVLDGRVFAHIVDPRTGLGVGERCAASVLAPSGTQADALATAAVVLGAEGVAALAERHPGAEFRVVCHSNESSPTLTEGFAARLRTQPR